MINYNFEEVLSESAEICNEPILESFLDAYKFKKEDLDKPDKVKQLIENIKKDNGKSQIDTLLVNLIIQLLNCVVLFTKRLSLTGYIVSIGISISSLIVSNVAGANSYQVIYKKLYNTKKKMEKQIEKLEAKDDDSNKEDIKALKDSVKKIEENMKKVEKAKDDADRDNGIL